MSTDDFARLYAEHAHGLYAFLSYRTGDRVLAEDLLADTFARVLRARRGYDRRKAGERTWLYAIALNCLRDSTRRAAAEERALTRAGIGTDSGVSSDFDDLVSRGALREALQALPDHEREAVALRYGAELSLAEIATVIDEPRSKVESRIYRGLARLREALGRDFAAAGH